MIARLLFWIILGCVVQTALPQESRVGVNYAAIYDTIVRADQSLSKGEGAEAKQLYLKAQDSLRELSQSQPNWNPEVIRFRLQDVHKKLQRLEKPRSQQPPPATPETTALDSSAAIRTLEDLQRRVNQLQSERNDLNEKLKEALSASPAPEISPEELQTAKEEIKRLKKERDVLELQLNDEREKIEMSKSTADPRQRIAELTSTVEVLKLEKEALKTEVTRLESSTRASSEENGLLISSDTELLESQLETARVGLEEAERRIEAQDFEISELSADIEKLSAAQSRLKTENSRLRTIETALQEEIASYKARLGAETEYTDFDNRLTSLSETLAASRESNRKLRQENQELAVEAQRLRQAESQWLQEKSALESRIAQLERMIDSNGQTAENELVTRAQLDSLRLEATRLERELRAARTAESQTREKGLREVLLMRQRMASMEARLNALTQEPEPLTRRERMAISQAETESVEQSQMRQQLQRAENALRTALESEPENQEYRAQLTAVLIEQGRMDAAAEQISKGLTTDPNSVVFLIFDGTVHLTQGESDKAFESLARAVQLEPENAEAQMYLGIALFESKKIAAAETALRKAVKLDRNNPRAHYNLAVVYLYQTPPFRALGKYHYKRATNLGHPTNDGLESIIQGE